LGLGVAQAPRVYCGLPSTQQAAEAPPVRLVCCHAGKQPKRHVCPHSFFFQ